jgi:hypothetical protein
VANALSSSAAELGLASASTPIRTATVEPGLVLDHLNAALKKHGLWYPVVIAVVTAIVGLLLVREGKAVDIHA